MIAAHRMALSLLYLLFFIFLLFRFVRFVHAGTGVEGAASGAGLAVGEQLRAFRGGGERLRHGRQSHKSNGARTRFHVEAQNRETGFAPSCASTDAVPWLYRNPPIRISVKAQALNEHYRL